LAGIGQVAAIVRAAPTRATLSTWDDCSAAYTYESSTARSLIALPSVARVTGAPPASGALRIVSPSTQYTVPSRAIATAPGDVAAAKTAGFPPVFETRMTAPPRLFAK
jgi:hypothetical protein